MTNLPRVAVIIPTLGRASLQAAVHSVTTQSYENLEIVVSVDGPPGCVDIRNLPSEPSLHLVYGDKQRGPNSARLAGILASHSDYIAFLDDDDRWRSNKLELQMQSALREMSAGANHVVVACRSAIYNEHGDNIGIVPRRLLSPDETVAHYLFCRQTFRPGETGLGSSMLLFDRSLLDVIGLEPTSNLHEDWDLLLRADQLPNTRLVILPDVLLEYVSRPHSLSSQAPWQTSFSWFEERKPLLTRREYGDGLLNFTGSLALNQRDIRGLFTVAGKVLTNGRAGIPAWLLFVVRCLLPGSLLDRAKRFPSHRHGVAKPNDSL